MQYDNNESIEELGKASKHTYFKASKSVIIYMMMMMTMKQMVEVVVVLMMTTGPFYWSEHVVGNLYSFKVILIANLCG
jgi:hypothetical protein